MSPKLFNSNFNKFTYHSPSKTPSKTYNVFAIFIFEYSILFKLPSDLLIPFRSTFSKWIFFKEMNLFQNYSHKVVYNISLLSFSCLLDL